MKKFLLTPIIYMRLIRLPQKELLEGKYTKFTLHYLKNIFDIQDEIKNRTLTNRPVKEFTLESAAKLVLSQVYLQ